MITIKTVKDDEKNTNAELKIAKGTPYRTMLLGCEMLIEALMNTGCCATIDDLFDDLKRIYERDNKKNDGE